jgi:hypothetical protein
MGANRCWCSNRRRRIFPTNPSDAEEKRTFVGGVKDYVGVGSGVIGMWCIATAAAIAR